MKIIITICLCVFISLGTNAQTKEAYKIKIVQKDRRITRGLFYAVTSRELIILKNNSDTVKINLANIKDLYISKKGIILPFTLTGAGVALVAAAETELPLVQAAYIIAGIPVGMAIGNLVGQLFANKRFYKSLELADFPNIHTDLEKYTQVKTNR